MPARSNEPEGRDAQGGEANLPHVPDEDANVSGEQARRVVEEESETPRGASEEGGGLDRE